MTNPDFTRARYYLAEAAKQRAEAAAARARGRWPAAEAFAIQAKRDAERALFWLSPEAPDVPAPDFMVRALQGGAA